MQVIHVFEIGFLLGLLGSVHCIGMCGPLVMALPFSKKYNLQKLIGLFLYLFGKTLSYTLLGILFGFFGSQFPFFAFQQNISVLMGISMLFYFFFAFVIKPKSIRYKLFHVFNNNVQKWIGFLFKNTSVTSFLLIGALNGLLPCGMIYFALSSALSTQNVMNGALLMTFFGIGTMPMLVFVAIGGQLMSLSLRIKIQKVFPIFILSIGLILILRGLNLGIPYLSPILGIGNNVISCHN